MDVKTWTIEAQEAMAALSMYSGLTPKQRTPEDDALIKLYKAVTKGARVLNIIDAFKTTGLNESGEPRLAIARADWRSVLFAASRAYQFSNGHWTSGSSGNFRQLGSNSWRKGTHIEMPQDTFNQRVITDKNLQAPVPHIPPGIRPKIKLSNFHILFEVEKWNEYPVDPFLLRHISGYLYAVVAEWELTELEASLLGSIRSGN